MRRWVIFFIPFIMMLACNATLLKEDTVSYTVLESGDSISPSLLSYRGSNIKFFSDKTSYRLFYTRLHIDEVPKQRIPSVDFEKNSVLFFSFGQYRNAGCSIKLLNIYVKNNVMIVEADYFLRPMLTRVVTHCYLLISVPKEGYRRVELRNSRGEILEKEAIRTIR